MNNTAIKFFTLSIACLYTSLTHADGDLPNAAKIIAEAAKRYEGLAEKLIAMCRTNVRFDSADITLSARAVAEALSQADVHINTLHFANPTIHLGSSSAQTLLELARAIEKGSQYLSQTGSSIGLNPATAALAEKILARLEKLDPSKLNGFKLSNFLDRDPKVVIQVETGPLALEPKTIQELSMLMTQAGYVMTGIGAGALAIILSSLLANKHINQKDAEFSKADGVATLATLALAAGAWALIRYSSVLTQAA
ncbi:MAG: hypothetical protein K2X90_03520 [Candidatus Babeliaceae bacterium]|nr:hypothetical protein [Candidatus Babeliaceae bacterium]